MARWQREGTSCSLHWEDSLSLQLAQACPCRLQGAPGALAALPQPGVNNSPSYELTRETARTTHLPACLPCLGSGPEGEMGRLSGSSYPLRVKSYHRPAGGGWHCTADFLAAGTRVSLY